MKTTVDLPDDLLIAAKKRAAELRKPLRELIEAGLREQLRRRPPARSSNRKKIRWVIVKGGVPAGLDLSDRAAMHDWLRRNP